MTQEQLKQMSLKELCHYLENRGFCINLDDSYNDLLECALLDLNYK